MYYRVAIQEESTPLWKWKSTALSDLAAVFQLLRLYRPLGLHGLRVFSSFSREELNEQLVRVNQGLESTSITAAQFLQERLIGLPELAWRTSTRANERTTSIANISEQSLGESSRKVHVPDGMGICPLEKRREELESGAGGDHDIPYRFTLPDSMRQVLAWTKLREQVYIGTFQP
jgi:hypothetical protein